MTSTSQLNAEIEALPVDVAGLKADKNLLGQYSSALTTYAAGADFAVNTTTMVVNIAKELHDAAETAIIFTGATSIAVTGAELLTQQGCQLFAEYATQQVVNVAQGMAINYLSSAFLNTIAQSLGLDPQYLQIAADGLQLLSLLQAAKNERLAAGANCFVAGTQVLTAQGPGNPSVFSEKDIQDIAVGDEVLTRDQDDPNAPVEEGLVTQVFQHTTYQLEDVTITDAAGASETIQATPTHPFYVDGIGWTDAGDLLAGEHLLDADGSESMVASVSADACPQGVTVYNFTVAADHTYFVGSDAHQSGDFVWVHNNCGPSEWFKDPADAIGDLNGEVTQVGSGLTKDATWNGWGYTQTYYYVDSNGQKWTVFFNPKLELYSGAHQSSGQ